MANSRIMVRPAIRCSRCIPISDTKQRAAATIRASFDGRLLRNGFSTVTGKSSAVTGKPSAVTGKSSAATGKSSAVTGKSSAATGKPSAVTGKPSTVTGKSNF